MDVRRQKVGECQLDVGQRGVVRDGELCRLEPRDYNVLLHLVENAPNMVTTRSLLRRGWRSKIVGDNVLHQSIGRLRRVLGDDAKKPIYIQTLAKMGYQFIAPVTPLGRLRDQSPELNPIAVMPFRDYSREPNDPYVVDGLCFEICHQLMQKGAQVVSLDTAARIQRRGFTDLEVGGRVGARTVLGGSLIVSGNKLRVTVTLNDVESERQLWSAKHDFTTGQILELHTLLSETIVNSIYDRLGGLEDVQDDFVETDQGHYYGNPQLGF
jgi:DNA-binding winged helix-turn-helix (wHTH) protein